MAWTLVKSGEEYGNFGYGHKEFQLSSEADIQSPPDEAINSAIGSKAYLQDYSKIWNKSDINTWILCSTGGGGGGGGGTAADISYDPSASYPEGTVGGAIQRINNYEMSLVDGSLQFIKI